MRDSLWNLTPAEARVVQTLRPGCTKHKAIAEALGMKKSTVSGHLENIRQKMDVYTTVEILLKVWEEGL